MGSAPVRPAHVGERGQVTAFSSAHVARASSVPCSSSSMVDGSALAGGQVDDLPASTPADRAMAAALESDELHVVLLVFLV